jgi:very-short-patch-repair endonuclease
VGQVARTPLGGIQIRQESIGPFYADFVCREEKLIVEVDGATHSTPEEIARDARRESFLRDFGHRILRVTNDDVINNLDGVCETILAALPQR